MDPTFSSTTDADTNVITLLRTAKCGFARAAWSNRKALLVYYKLVL